MSGAKTVDLRGWNTKYRGDILIHAPLRVREADCRRLRIRGRPLTGVILGRVTLADVRMYGSAQEVRRDYPLHLAGADFESKKYGFVLENPVKLKAPVPYKGSLGLFEARVADTPKSRLIRDIMEEDYTYQWVGRH